MKGSLCRTPRVGQMCSPGLSPGLTYSREPTSTMPAVGVTGLSPSPRTDPTSGSPCIDLVPVGKEWEGGFTLVEMLVVMVLTGLLLGSAFSLLASVSGSVAQGMERWDRLEAVRTVWVAVERELRPGLADRDWRVTTGGVLELRAFRGFARICGPAGEPGVFPAAWHGDRLPVPQRDSVLVLGQDGGWRGGSLTRWTEAQVGCNPTPGEREGWVSWSGAGGEPPVLVRLFERGAYSFHQGAFRYERGYTGRQPLTPELFGPGSRFHPESFGISVELVYPQGPGGERPAPVEPLNFRVGHGDS